MLDEGWRDRSEGENDLDYRPITEIFLKKKKNAVFNSVKMDQVLNKVGTYWFSKKANKELSSVGDDINVRHSNLPPSPHDVNQCGFGFANVIY